MQSGLDESGDLQSGTPGRPVRNNGVRPEIGLCAAVDLHLPLSKRLPAPLATGRQRFGSAVQEETLYTRTKIQNDGLSSFYIAASSSIGSSSVLQRTQEITILLKDKK